MKTCQILTFGCKVNQCESAWMAQRLKSAGYQTAGNGHPPEICLINTCAVTARAARQARQAVRQQIRRFPHSRIIVTGCAVEAEKKTFEIIDGVDLLVPRKDKARFLEQLSPNPPTVPAAQAFFPLNASPDANRSRPFLKIQDGCNTFCTYCIVPYTRGRSRSMPVSAVIANLENFHRMGFRETVLTGIHLGMFGQDLTPATSLTGLLDMITAGTAMKRIRLSSIEPNELTPALVDKVANSNRFCPHFHIPLQSGDDGILRKMRRPYTAKAFSELILMISSRRPTAAIGVDVLVGFPGESDSAFQHTCALIEKLPVTYLHVFPFSLRPGTPAASMPDQVPGHKKRERCSALRRLGEAKKQRFYERQVGRRVSVVMESIGRNPEKTARGFSENYLPVHIRVDGRIRLVKNEIYEVDIKSMDKQNRPWGEISGYSG